MKKGKTICWLMSLIVLSSCARKEPQELVQLVNNPKGEFTKSHSETNKGVKLSMVFKPAEFNALMEISGDANYLKEYKNALKEQEQSLRFDFRIEGIDPGYDVLKDTLPPDLYLERIEYLTAEFSNQLSLVVGGDTLAPSFFHFERTYNIIPYNNFLLGFDIPRDQVIEDITLIYNDVLFGLGKREFQFNQSLISQKYSIDL